MRKLVHCFVGLAVIPVTALAQEVFPLYSGPAPGTEDWEYAVDEKEYFSPIFNTEVVTNVSQPTLTAYLPKKSKANGTAVIIAREAGFTRCRSTAKGTTSRNG